MQTLLQAGFVSIDEIDGALVVGFADRQYDTSQYFMFQRSLDPSDDDGVYLEHTDQAYGIYGQVTSCSLSSCRIELTVDERTAEHLETEGTFAIDFSCDHESLLRLQSGLERILSGTTCRFSKAAPLNGSIDGHALQS
jgi:Immunity protein 10